MTRGKSAPAPVRTFALGLLTVTLLAGGGAVVVVVTVVFIDGLIIAAFICASTVARDGTAVIFIFTACAVVAVPLTGVLCGCTLVYTTISDRASIQHTVINNISAAKMLAVINVLSFLLIFCPALLLSPHADIPYFSPRLYLQSAAAHNQVRPIITYITLILSHFVKFNIMLTQ